MANELDYLRAYTPTELAQMQQILAQRYQDGALQNQTMNTVANMTKNLSPAANLGIALGTLGGKWAAQRYNSWQDEQFLKAYDDYRRRQEVAKNLPSFENARNAYVSASLPSFDAAKKAVMTQNISPPQTTYSTAPSTSVLTGNNPSYDWRSNLRSSLPNNPFANPYQSNQPTEWDKMQARYTNRPPSLLRYNY